MDIITSTDNKKVIYLTKLKDKKYRDEENLFLVETYHLIEEAYLKGVLKELIILDGTELPFEVQKTYVNEKVMSKISSLSKPGKFIGVVNKFIPNAYGNRLIILDNIQDPGNLGTIIRSSVAFNIDTIILSETCVDMYNDKTIRATEGMIFKSNVLRKNLNTFIKELQDNNYKIYGTDVINGHVVSEVDFPTKTAIIIGSEGNGISEEIKKLVDENIYIPMSEDVESLNAAVASSIIMYEMSKIDYE